MGFNFFIASGIYFSAEHSCRYFRGGVDDVWNSIIGGVTSGSLLSGLYAGRRKLPIGALLFSTCGVSLFYFDKLFQQWKENARHDLLQELKVSPDKYDYTNAEEEFAKTQELNSSLFSLPSWSPIQKIEPTEYEEKLKKRKKEIDEELNGG
eukprot:g4036.t1